MASSPAVLLWVNEVAFSERRGVTVLHCHDYREDFGWLGQAIPGQLFVLRGQERLVLAHAHLAHVHRWNKGWAWETNTPERLPPAPFLLTDDTACRCLFCGEVGIEPSSWAQEEITAQFAEYGVAPVPALGTGWFGVLDVSAGQRSAHLLAFSREPRELSDGIHEVAWAGEKKSFGRIMVPVMSDRER